MRRMAGPPKPEHLRRQLIRLIRALFDISCADALAAELEELPDDDISPRAWGLLTGTVVSYMRPFSDSYAYGRLESKWSRFPNRPDLKNRHDRQIERRNSLLAHNDLTEHRDVVIFTTGAFLDDRPTVTEERSPINVAGISGLRELLKYQEDRMWEAAYSLLDKLAEAEQWPPGIEIRLSDETFGPRMGHGSA
jgi:hypothetical protein